MLAQFLQMQSLGPADFFSTVPHTKIMSKRSPVKVPLVGAKREYKGEIDRRARKRPLLKPPPTPNPRVLSLAKRNLKLLTHEHLFGKYHDCTDIEMGRQISKGSFGEVRMVTCRRTGEVLVLKRSLKPLIGEASLKQERAHSKILALFANNYPHLLRHHAAWVEEAHVYLITDLCPGGDLFMKLSKGPFSNQDSIRIVMLDVGKGLQRLHSMGFIHADIKPQNIFLGPDGRYVIGDFGNMCLIGGNRVPDMDCRYRPRETLNGTLTPSADTFGLGLVLVECAMEESLPKSGERWSDIRDGRGLFSRCKIDLSLGLKRMIESMLAPAPAKRPTARQVVEFATTTIDDEKIVGGEPKEKRDSKTKTVCQPTSKTAIGAKDAKPCRKLPESPSRSRCVCIL